MYRTLLKWSYRTCFAGNRREDRKEPASPPRGPARIADVWVRPHTSDPHVSEVAVLQASHFHPPRSPPSPSRSRLCVEETQASMQRTAGNPRVHAFSARSLCPIGNCPTMRTKPSLPLLQASQALPVAKATVGRLRRLLPALLASFSSFSHPPPLLSYSSPSGTR